MMIHDRMWLLSDKMNCVVTDAMMKMSSELQRFPLPRVIAVASSFKAAIFPFSTTTRSATAARCVRDEMTCCPHSDPHRRVWEMVTDSTPKLPRKGKHVGALHDAELVAASARSVVSPSPMRMRQRYLLHGLAENGIVKIYKCFPGIKVHLHEPHLTLLCST